MSLYRTEDGGTVRTNELHGDVEFVYANAAGEITASVTKAPATAHLMLVALRNTEARFALADRLNKRV